MSGSGKTWYHLELFDFPKQIIYHYIKEVTPLDQQLNQNIYFSILLWQPNLCINDTPVYLYPYLFTYKDLKIQVEVPY